jgi:pimeloyl-ACP methyl ester carboxylesterase
MLLVMGQMASMLWWPDGLCERLAAGGRFVIRYDNRDTGRSTSYPPGHPEYGSGELVDDLLAILDSYGIPRAHVVGMSMGGMVAQKLALREPQRVATLTLVSTTPIAGGDLPPPSKAYLDAASAFGDIDWSDPDQVAEMIVADARALAGRGRPFDEAAAREFVAADIARTRNPAALVNHTLLADDEASEPVADDALAQLGVPVLAIHGTDDPLFPPAHGEALARSVPKGELVLLPGSGHELHPDDWDAIAAATLAHTAS